MELAVGHFGKDLMGAPARKEKRQEMHVQRQKAEWGFTDSHLNPLSNWKAPSGKHWGLSKRTLKTSLIGKSSIKEANALEVQVLLLLRYFMNMEQRDSGYGGCQRQGALELLSRNKGVKDEALHKPASDVCIWSTRRRLFFLPKVPVLVTNVFLSFGYLPTNINLVPQHWVRAGASSLPPHELRTHGFYCLSSHPRGAATTTILN